MPADPVQPTGEAATHPGTEVTARDLLTGDIERVVALIREVMPTTMGGYPDLFAPASTDPGVDPWEEWERRARAALDGAS